MGRVLVDTQLLLWSLYRPKRVPREIRDVIEGGANDILFSAASIWEIAIKRALGRPDFVVEPSHVISDSAATGFMELPVTAAAAAQVSTLPPVHKDPFDRLLIAQAIHEPARLLTSDRILARYSTLVQPFDPH
jgi:PIN domain nuclease of toxin-antitoxin system